MFLFGYFLSLNWRGKPNLANPSDVVFVEIGLYGVAEAAALEAAMLQTGGAKASLFIEKQKAKDATLALVKMAAPLVDQRLLRGRKPGKVMLIELGQVKVIKNTSKLLSGFNQPMNWLAMAFILIFWGQRRRICHARILLLVRRSRVALCA